LILYFSDLSFFFNDTSTTDLYTLSLHDALPIFQHTHIGHVTRIDIIQRPWNTVDHHKRRRVVHGSLSTQQDVVSFSARRCRGLRSEEHTSELQSRENLVCRLLLEKKKKNNITDV